MATRYTKQDDTEKRIKAQNEEISYLKMKIYKLIATNKNLREELNIANHKIKNLEYSSSYKNPRNKQVESKKSENEKWQKVKSRRNRRYKWDTSHARNTHSYRTRESNDIHNEMKQAHSERAREDMASNPRNHRLPLREKPMINKPQRTTYHTEKNAKRNETSKNEKSQTRRHVHSESTERNNRSRYHAPRSPERPAMKRDNRDYRRPDTRYKRNGHTRSTDDY